MRSSSAPAGGWSEAFVGNELRSRKAVHLFERGEGGGQLDVWFQWLIGSC